VTQREPPDDPRKDFRERYALPEHFLWDEADRQRVQYDGYTRVAIELLPQPPLDVLDAGCGDGFLARRLVSSGYAVWGIDYSDRAIAYARILVPEATFRVFDLRSLGTDAPFEHRFGAALLVEVLEHVPPAHHDAVLRGLFRTLAPGGCVVLSVPSVHLKPVNRYHYKHFTREEVEALLSRAGFVVTDVVCQRRLSVLWSHTLWRCLKNRYYDLRALRLVLRGLLLAHWNVTADPGKAGRYLFKAVKA
jgi:2-polyprenyl-3-methyl-5-hydroxy-6-metoxy-1,4-benzoquinol methylase